MPLQPDDHKDQRGHAVAGSRRAADIPGCPDGASGGGTEAANPDFVQTDQDLQRRIARLEAENAALRAEAERTRLILRAQSTTRSSPSTSRAERGGSVSRYSVSGPIGGFPAG
jgi:hypothetical protein